jgi:hypothetical protein
VDPDATVRAYAGLVVAHIALDDGDRVPDAFVADLRSPDPVVRRQAAGELAAGLSAVWAGGFWGETPPVSVRLPNNARHFVWDQEAHRRHSPQAVGERHRRLLDAIITAARADTDTTLRRRLGQTLIRIAQAVCARTVMSERSGPPRATNWWWRRRSGKWPRCLPPPTRHCRRS